MSWLTTTSPGRTLRSACQNGEIVGFANFDSSGPSADPPPAGAPRDIPGGFVKRTGRVVKLSSMVAARTAHKKLTLKHLSRRGAAANVSGLISFLAKHSTVSRTPPQSDRTYLLSRWEAVLGGGRETPFRCPQVRLSCRSPPCRPATVSKSLVTRRVRESGAPSRCNPQQRRCAVASAARPTSARPSV